MCASGVSFQSMRALANDDVSLVVGKFWNGSHKSRENGSKMLLLRPVPNTLGMIDIIVLFAQKNIVTVKCFFVYIIGCVC